MNRQRGFTLIELMITLAIVAIVLSIGVPSFQEMIRSNRFAAYTNDFLSSLNLARSEAIKRGVRVSLCKSADGVNCTTSGGYQQGWIVFIDPSNPLGATTPTVDAGEQILRVYGAVLGGFELTGNINVQSYVSYVGSGMSQLLSGGFQAGTLTLCVTPKARLIVINSTGRARVAESGC
ncbi:MAG: GspH/FimT family pseudopilin [Candidatus Competibacteraceae bacterium]|nr:GspH/FimT family pseudopilin [Candidatus Competibacteraceae bacterium]MBK8755165.1 GspH/FimT family pseudopilin [Candidatus Competibacteraceae bacterium]